ncbi:hypothetical protein DL96DRAFT_1610649 [Flagelloscypha sp. PMI_526]|nr:hypothetical protein DL96DRAFT_1610649 [Flagelloscypha sp. PMI_526]
MEIQTKMDLRYLFILTVSTLLLEMLAASQLTARYVPFMVEAIYVFVIKCVFSLLIYRHRYNLSPLLWPTGENHYFDWELQFWACTPGPVFSPLWNLLEVL